MKHLRVLGLAALPTAIFAVTALLLAGAGTARALAAGQEERVLSDTESRRFEAMTKGDLATLDGLLAEEMTYTHSTGQLETKQQFLDDLRSGKLKYEFIAPEDVLVRLYGSAGVVTGRARMQVRMQGQALGFQIRYTDVYAKRNGRWRLVAWQSTRLPEP